MIEKVGNKEYICEREVCNQFSKPLGHPTKGTFPL